MRRHREQVTLPAGLYQRTLAEMKPGEYAWVTPWTMHVSPDGLCWVDGASVWDTEDNEPGGTVTMLLHRAEDGFEVELTREWRWSPEARPASAIPVVRLETRTIKRWRP